MLPSDMGKDLYLPTSTWNIASSFSFSPHCSYDRDDVHGASSGIDLMNT